LETSQQQLFDSFIDAIADRLYLKMTANTKRNTGRLMDVQAAAEYIGRTPSAVRHLIAKGAIPCVRRDGRVQLDREDLDKWLELGKVRG